MNNKTLAPSGIGSDLTDPQEIERRRHNTQAPVVGGVAGLSALGYLAARDYASSVSSAKGIADSTISNKYGPNYHTEQAWKELKGLIDKIGPEQLKDSVVNNLLPAAGIAVGTTGLYAGGSALYRYLKNRNQQESAAEKTSSHHPIPIGSTQELEASVGKARGNEDAAKRLDKSIKALTAILRSLRSKKIISKVRDADTAARTKLQKELEAQEAMMGRNRDPEAAPPKPNPEIEQQKSMEADHKVKQHSMDAKNKIYHRMVAKGLADKLKSLR